MSARIFMGMVIFSLPLGACTHETQLSGDGRTVLVGTADAPPELEEIGEVEVTHGDDDCGGFQGSYAVATTLLRNRAADMGASYVKVLETRPPTRDDDCARNDWMIRGLAYRGTWPGGSTTANQTPEPATSGDETPPAPATSDDVPAAPAARPPAAPATSGDETVTPATSDAAATGDDTSAPSGEAADEPAAAGDETAPP
jgi:hypothetical protein